MNSSKLYKYLLPTSGNIIFTVLMISITLWVQSVSAVPLMGPAAEVAALVSASSTCTIPYQAHLADTDDKPLEGTYSIVFRFYKQATGGTAIWTEQWNGNNKIKAEAGLFHVILGSRTEIPRNIILDNDTLFIGITIESGSELTPRQEIDSLVCHLRPLIPDGNGNVLIDGHLTMTANKNLGPLGNIYDVGNIYGRGDQGERVQLHMPGGTNVGHLFINWHEGRKLIYGGGKAQTQMSVDTDGHMYLRGDFTAKNINSLANINRVGNIYGHGSENNRKAQIHMPGGSNIGNLYINWHQGGKLIYGGGQGKTKMSVDTNGNLWVAGELQAAGAKPAIVETESYGRRKMYAVEDAEVRFTDEGLGTLENGVARIDLDPIFMETIEGAYLVHVTPYGDAMLYVDERADSHFTVKAREDHSNIQFAWRLSAIRKGYGDVRMETAE